MEEGVWQSGGVVGEPKAHDLPAAAETLIARQSAPVAVFPEEFAPAAGWVPSDHDPFLYMNMQYYNPELDNNDATIFITRRSLNFMRFMDGLAGLTFSN
jgi:hypothetical protein